MRISDWSSDVCSSDLSALNLRGLGPDATLTLFNGHRVAYDAIGQGVDISAVPLAAVDRIEVLTDGSSALYGSDAVGGVANVILRRDYDGAVASARVGGATDGGDFEQQYNLVRSEEHTSELQSLMRTSYAVFCLKKKNNTCKYTQVYKRQQQTNS